MKYERNVHGTFVDYWWDVDGIRMEYSDNTWMEYGRNAGGINLFGQGWVCMNLRGQMKMDMEQYG